jgi:hypothetical protein
MYRFSRSIYRELAPRVIEDENDPTGCRNRQVVLEACEAAVRRLSTDRRYFARPARSLFNEVRVHFSMGDQLHVWGVIESNIALALDLLERAPELLVLDGVPRECRAHTRKGTPCQREPLPGRDYCPSHKHLEETFEAAEVDVERPDGALVAV